jgi:hypothetical protein
MVGKWRTYNADIYRAWLRFSVRIFLHVSLQYGMQPQPMAQTNRRDLEETGCGRRVAAIMRLVKSSMISGHRATEATINGS